MAVDTNSITYISTSPYGVSIRSLVLASGAILAAIFFINITLHTSKSFYVFDSFTIWSDISIYDFFVYSLEYAIIKFFFI
jgi:hypothetical protein